MPLGSCSRQDLLGHDMPHSDSFQPCVGSGGSDLEQGSRELSRDSRKTSAPHELPVEALKPAGSFYMAPTEQEQGAVHHRGLGARPGL